MVLFQVSKKFPFPTKHLQQYFMCHKIWQAAMPYKLVKITPEEKHRWNWRIKDSINFVLFKWNFEHRFISIQEDHADHLFIKFENSNQVEDFTGKILFSEEKKEGNLENTVTIQFSKLRLKDPLLNTVKFAFVDTMKKDYKVFLDNVFKIVLQKQESLSILEDCYWTDYETIQFPKEE